MAIAVVGDIHGHTGVVHKLDEEISHRPQITVVIQAGDFGFTRDSIRHYQNNPLKCKWYVIDGNHEDYNVLKDITEPTELAPNLVYVPRGSILTIDGRTIAFMGGAASVDKAHRIRNGWMWFEEENITTDQIRKFVQNVQNSESDIDIMVTHCPPQWMIRKHFSPLNLLQFGLPATWTDFNANTIEDLWELCGQPLLIAGHMHKSVVDGNCRILDINELYVNVE
jgi:predicted phosphodiesterase